MSKWTHKYTTGVCRDHVPGLYVTSSQFVQFVWRLKFADGTIAIGILRAECQAGGGT